MVFEDTKLVLSYEGFFFLLLNTELQNWVWLLANIQAAVQRETAKKIEEERNEIGENEREMGKTIF